MTEEELSKYICQIALSGALDFIQKYEGEQGGDDGIIGHFGLGFYSAFMVSTTVDVLTRSYKGTNAVKWSCTDDGNYVISEPAADEAPQRGTSVVMHLGSEGEEYLESGKLRQILDKYCAFMPVEIYFSDGSEEEKKESDGSDEKDKNPTAINDIHPLWLKNPSECTDDEYKEFYRKVFHDYREPLFWIHIKADYPLNFKGILYFPRIVSEFDSLEGQVKLFYNQVFVADNIKEVIPEYLLMLKGVLDCPELPLNVSRSYLQNSGYVTKISNHITKKVADKLNYMFSTDREGYEKLWRDLKTFVEYGCLRDSKFYDKISSSIVYEKCDGKYTTLDEYLDKAAETHKNKVYYAADKVSQAGYISMFDAENIEVLLLDRIIDAQFAQLIESKRDGVKFCRVDSELADTMKGDGVEEISGVADIFKKFLPKETEVKFEALKDSSLPAVLNISEDSRRMEDMMKMYSAMGEGPAPAFPTQATLILNTSNSLISSLPDSAPEKQELLAKQIYNLCLISQRKLTSDELKAFLNDSYNILGMI